MKTLFTTLILAISVLLTGIQNNASAAINLPSFESAGQIGQSNLVNAIMVDGQLMPVVDLPVVEIVAPRNGATLLPGTVVKGKIIAIANLPVVEIFASRLNNRIPAVSFNGEIIPSVDLPVIEISDDMPLNNLVMVSTNENGTIPVMNLPVVEITGQRITRAQVNSLEASFFPLPVAKFSFDEDNSLPNAILVDKDANSGRGYNMALITLKKADAVSIPEVMNVLSSVNIPYPGFLYKEISKLLAK